MIYLAAAIVTLVCLLAVGLSLLTLPGAWLALCAAILCQWWQPEMFSWWTLGICTGLALLGEVVEIVASSLGAAKAGGSKAGGWGAFGGSIIGLIGGSFFLPPIGTIVGAVIGAGTGALLIERHVSKKTWEDATKVGTGAAAGRLVATAIKIAIAAVVALTLTVAAWWP